MIVTTGMDAFNVINISINGWVKNYYLSLNINTKTIWYLKQYRYFRIFIRLYIELT